VLQVRVKPRAERQIAAAVAWWAENRPAARGAVLADLRGALEMLVLEPGIGSKVETSRSDVVRRLYLGRIHYFVYYRVRRNTLEVVAFRHERRGSAPNIAR
jgi:plasmid stabilization system protein ParE